MRYSESSIRRKATRIRGLYDGYRHMGAGD